MRILYIGDIMGEVGIAVVEKILPELRRQGQIDIVIAQAENVTAGKGISQLDFGRLKKLDIDFFTGGNWSLHQADIYPALSDPVQPIVRPANYPEGTAGLDYKYLQINKGKVLMVSLLGKIVGRDAELPMDNPLQKIDAILEQEKDTDRIATVVNLHGDYSSEKVVIGYYLDGKVTMVVGDHWHVPTADAQILPQGTAHQTDVGMCGSLDSSLGVTFGSVIPRWRDGQQTKNVLELNGRRQFNAVLVDSDDATGLATSIKTIRQIFEG